jgi:PAS domain S-box-containing protein
LKTDSSVADANWERRSQKLLAEAGVALAASLDYQTTLSTIANLAVTDFAEWCSVDVLTDSGELDKVVIAHADMSRVQWAQEFAAKYPTDLSSNTGVSAVLNSGESLWVSEVFEEMIARTAKNESHLADLLLIGVGSAIITALKAGDRTLGVITYIHSERGHFTCKHLELAEELSRRAALALDNARLYTQAKRELEERRRVQQELHASELRFRELADAMPVMIWVVSPDREVTFTNRHHRNYTGFGRAGIENASWEDVVHPEDSTEALATHLNAMKMGTTWEHAMRLRRHDGEYRWHLSRALPAFDKAGNLLRWFGTSTDIHEQKLLSDELEKQVQMRTRQLQEALARAETFDYSIAHDLRAPLRAIVSTSKILQKEAGDNIGDSARELLERQARNALRLSTLIDNLLQLSHLARVGLTTEVVDVSALALALVKGNSSPLKVEVEEGLGCVGDRRQIATLLECLLDNARKFSERGTIRVGKKGETFFVSDEGIGFDMAFASKVFLPFERLVLEGQYPGTGVGLAIAERIVTRHGGSIWIESEPQKGTTVFFQLSAP